MVVAIFITDFHGRKFLKIGFKSEAYLYPSRTSTMKRLGKTVNGFGKHCAGVSSLIKLLAALKKEIPVQVFSCAFLKFLGIPF